MNKKKFLEEVREIIWYNVGNRKLDLTIEQIEDSFDEHILTDEL